jgi:hypothetical protein
MAKQQKRKGSKGRGKGKLCHTPFVYFREEVFPLDLLRLLLQFLPIHDIISFNEAYKQNHFSEYLKLACDGLLVYDGKLKRTQNMTWVVSSGLHFQELAIYPNQLSLELISKSQQALTSIDFSGTPVTSKVILDLLQCPQLASVNFSSCSSISTSAMTSLFSSHQNLTSINISRCNVDDSVLTSAAFLSQLRHLDISHNPWVTNETIALIARECQKLLTLDISSTNVDGNDEVRDLLLNCGELQSFRSIGVWSLTRDTRVLVYATVCHRQLYSNDPRKNLNGAETFQQFVERGEFLFIPFKLRFIPCQVTSAPKITTTLQVASPD